MSRRSLASLLAIFLGFIGIHKFYLNRPGLGIVYLIFSWTFIPAIFGVLEGVCYTSMSEMYFNSKYPNLRK